MNKLAAATGLLLIFTFAVMGCGDSTTTNGSTGTSSGETATAATDTISTNAASADAAAPDPCSIIDELQAGGIMGEAVGEHVHMEVQKGESCAYPTVKTPSRTLTMTIIKPCSSADYENLADGNPVEGLGMHAAWNKSILTVHTDDNACIVTDGGGPARTDAPGDDSTSLRNAEYVATILIESMKAGITTTGPESPMDQM